MAWGMIKSSVRIWVLGLALHSCTPKENSDSSVKIPPATPITLERIAGLPVAPQPADNIATVEGVALGKALFFDPILSGDNTVSCASCHRPDIAFTDALPVSVGIRDQRTEVSSMSLVNLAWQNKFFWNGRVNTLEEQSLHPLLDVREMDLPLAEAVRKLEKHERYPDMFHRAFGSKEITSERIGKALAQYERTLISGNSRYDRHIRGLEQLNSEEIRGMQLFFTHPDSRANLRGGNCGDCHMPISTAGIAIEFRGFHNNGIQRTTAGGNVGLQQVTGLASDWGRFKAPTLRNIELTAPYMHDGRFNTLEEVLDHYNGQDLFDRPNVDTLIVQGKNERFGTSLGLTANEKKAIIAFLKTLTDTTFINKHKNDCR